MEVQRINQKGHEIHPDCGKPVNKIELAVLCLTGCYFWSSNVNYTWPDENQRLSLAVGLCLSLQPNFHSCNLSHSLYICDKADHVRPTVRDPHLLISLSFIWIYSDPCSNPLRIDSHKGETGQCYFCISAFASGVRRSNPNDNFEELGRFWMFWAMSKFARLGPWCAHLLLTQRLSGGLTNTLLGNAELQDGCLGQWACWGWSLWINPLTTCRRTKNA